MRFNDRAANRQSHSHTVGLCGEERAKYPIGVFRADTDASIFDCDQHIPGTVDCRPDTQNSASILDGLHCVNGIANQIENDLLHLYLVGRYKRKCIIQADVDGHGVLFELPLGQ